MDMVGAEVAGKIIVVGTTDRRDFGAGKPRNLNCGATDLAGCAVDQQPCARCDPGLVDQKVDSRKSSEEQGCGFCVVKIVRYRENTFGIDRQFFVSGGWTARSA